MNQRAQGLQLARSRVVAAAHTDEQEDRSRREERDDEGRPSREFERERAEPEEEKEHNRPDKGLDALIDARHAQVHRRAS